jgi:ABC-2 type transport system permease protein
LTTRIHREGATGFREFLKLYRNTLYHYLVPFRWRVYFPLFFLLTLAWVLLSVEFIGFRKVFQYMNSLQDLTVIIVQFLLQRFLGLIFLISYSMVFMSSIINGLSTFFLSANLSFLHTLPISRWRILLLKFVETWIISCYLVLLFLACFLASYIHTFNLGLSRYFLCAALLIVFTISPVALGSAMVTILIRFFPARRIYQVVTLIGGIFLAALMIAVRMMRPELLLNPKDTDDFIRLIRDMTFPSLNHLPSTWASEVVIGGDYSKGVLLLLFTIGTLVLLAVVQKIFYQRAYIQSQESRTLRERPSGKTRPTVHRGKIASLILKELKIFTRDATQWSQLLLLAALVVVYLINIKNLAIQMESVRWVVSFINLGLAGFVLAALSVRFLFPSVSSEGRCFWLIRTMPLSFRTLLWCKYLIYFPPFLLFTQLLVYFSNRILDVPQFFIALSMINIFAVSFALTGLAIGIGALMPNFRTDHPSKIAVGPGGVLYMLISFAYLAIMLIIQIRPVWFWVIERSDELQNYLYVAAAIILTLIVALVPMELGARQLAKREYL